VVADEVRRLAQQTETATVRFEQDIATMSQSVSENLSAIVEAGRTSKERHKIQHLTEALEKMDAGFEDVSRCLTQIAAESHASMDRIHQDIVGALGHMQFQDISRQQIEQVMAALEYLSEHSAVVKVSLEKPSTEWPPLQERIDALRQDYVMRRQRVTHATVTGQTAADESRPAIELF